MDSFTIRRSFLMDSFTIILEILLMDSFTIRRSFSMDSFTIILSVRRSFLMDSFTRTLSVCVSDDGWAGGGASGGFGSVYVCVSGTGSLCVLH